MNAPLNSSHVSPLQARHPVPLYAQIKEALRTRIVDGVYRQNDRLPSEHDLMRQYGVSRITVRQALGDLQSERVIFRVAGMGSFVARPKPFQELTRLQGFGEAMSRLGYETRNRVESITSVAATEIVSGKLGVPRGSMVSEIRRVRYLDGDPVSLDITYVPPSLGERLADEDLVTRDIFLIIENDYGILLGQAELSIEATLADSALATLLGIAVGAAVMRIERLTHASDGTPIDFEYLYYRGDAFRYQLRINRG